jgi:hypothetical protein
MQAAPVADVVIQSDANGLLVSAELNYNEPFKGMLRARAANAGPWEEFTIEPLNGGLVAIKSKANGLYVSAELNYTNDARGMLRARSPVVGAWEKFALVPAGKDELGDPLFAIKSDFSGLYVSAELNYITGYTGMLRARATTIGPWEKFNIRQIPVRMPVPNPPNQE